MWGRIQTLKKLGWQIDMVATLKGKPSKEDMQAVSSVVDQVFMIDRQRGWRAAAGLAPFQVLSRADLATVGLFREYDAVLLEAEHVASILQNPTLRAKNLILRVHNDEARFFQELSKSSKSFFHKAFCLSEAAKFKFFSRKIMSQCDALWFISDYERSEHVKRHPGDSRKSFFVPPRVDVNAMHSQSLEGRKTLFIGNLSLAVNSVGVEWYVENVHPSLRDVEGYSFVLAGRTGGSSRELLNKIAGTPHLSIYQDPPEIESFYRDAAVFVNPVFRGAGLKLKTIDAIQAGLPIVTTSTGVEGTGLVHGEHLLIADSPASFADSVRNLLDDKRLARDMVTAAQEFVAREFDQERIMRESLSKLGPGAL
jgi:glycosyltransferase involved in cell wall biosynthesis